MKELRAYELSAHGLAEAIANQEPLTITIGRSKVARLFVLPKQQWHEAIVQVYGNGAENEAKRVSTRTTRDELDEATMMSLLMAQVDAEWKPKSFGMLTLDGADAAYLVPANEYWRERVENGTKIDS